MPEQQVPSNDDEESALLQAQAIHAKHALVEKVADVRGTELETDRDGAPNNVVEDGAEGIGHWGGKCTCPDGEVYWVGDYNNGCGSLTCINGVGDLSTCTHHLGNWSFRGVECAAPCP